MQEPDGDLLQRFVSQRDEAAFDTLTTRYIGLIFHTALRRTGNRSLAEEISQNVLCAVAKKASALARNPDRLPAWLHRATLFESSKAMRSEVSYQRRKELRHPDQIAPTHAGDEPLWADAQPHLDEALDRLSESERAVVLKHYFEGASFTRIGEQLSRPAATVQKQCRRALGKLSRILRGRGVALSAAVLASGLGTQFSKAAPVTVQKGAAGAALTGFAGYSSTQLTLFMAIKSKAVLPLALFILLVPLGLQQLAISRAEARNESFRLALREGREASGRAPARSLRKSAGLQSSSGRITIYGLSRAQAAAKKIGGIKQIEFDEMLASLDADQLAALVPQAVELQQPSSDRRDLLTPLVGALTRFDPERAVRVICAANSNRPIVPNLGVEWALALWASERPDEAVDWIKSLVEQRRGSGRGVNGAWFGFRELQAALLGELIMADSPRVREVLSLAPEIDPAGLVRDATAQPTPASGSVFLEKGKGAVVERFSKFLPWIREYVPEKNRFLTRKEVIERLLFESFHTWWPDTGPVAGMVMDKVELLPTERRWVADYQALNMMSTYYSCQPRPDRAEVEEKVRKWLATYQPGEAAEIFVHAKEIASQRERRQVEDALEGLSRLYVVRDSDLIWGLVRHDFREFPEFLPSALELAQRIKDPVKRGETLRVLESQNENP